MFAEVPELDDVKQTTDKPKAPRAKSAGKMLRKRAPQKGDLKLIGSEDSDDFEDQFSEIHEDNEDEEYVDTKDLKNGALLQKQKEDQELRDFVGKF